MFKKIVVPLDGTPFAERALPLALSLARRLDGELILLFTTAPDHQEYFLTGPNKELIVLNEDYLRKVRLDLIDPDLPGHLQPDRVSYELEQMAPELAIGEVTPGSGGDLVVMATHARKGLYLLIKGSIAQKVLSQGTIVMLLTRAEEDLAELTLPELLRAQATLIQPTGPIKLLVALDGSPEAENILGPVTAFARQLDAAIYLEMVCAPYYSYEEPASSGSILALKKQQSRQEAFDYLKRVQDWLKTQELTAFIAVKQGDIVEQIQDYSDEIEADILALATHAREPLGQLILGSVATEVLRECSRPVLLVNNALWAREILENDFHYNFKPEPVLKIKKNWGVAWF